METFRTFTDDAHDVATPSAALRIVIVEDNPHFATTLRNNLEIEGFVVDLAETVMDGLGRILTTQPALVISDIVLPERGRTGFDLLQALRAAGSDVPVIILTGCREEENKLRGFGMGCDDFILKPVSLPELLARIRALLRRARPGFADVAPQQIRFADIEVEPATRTVRRDGEKIDLRPKEFDLLIALWRRHDHVVSRAELLRDVWGYHPSAASRTVDTHMAGLRQKLERHPLAPRHLLTVRAAGYMLRVHQAEC